MKKILISLTAAALMLLMCVYLASPALAAGTAPIAENLEIKTYRNVSVGGRRAASPTRRTTTSAGRTISATRPSTLRAMFLRKRP